MAASRVPIRKPGLTPETDVLAAERYLESLLDSEEAPTAEEVAAIRNSIDAVRRGEITLAEFEAKYER